MRFYKVLIFAAILCLGLNYLLLTPISYAESIDDIKIYTENYPPLNYQKNGKLVGYSVELIEAILEKLGSKRTTDDIELLPWARAYKIVQSQKNTCLFTVTYSPQRENLFKWVGPILLGSNAIVAKKSREISIDSIDDIKKYSIAATLNDIGEQKLIDKGIDKSFIQRVSGEEAPEKILLRLDKERVDLWSVGGLSYRRIAKEYGYNPNSLEIVYTLEQSLSYIVFNKDTSDSIVKKFQAALDTIKEEGTLKQLHKKYFN